MLTCSVHPLPYRANPADYFAAIRHAPGAVLLDSGRPVPNAAVMTCSAPGRWHN
jgi:hypothetical protein